MKVKICTAGALLLAIAACAQPDFRSRALYRALGNDPGWLLSISAAQMEFVGGQDGIRIVEVTPVAQPVQGGRQYLATQMTVSVTTVPCNDNQSGIAFSDRVRVVAGNRVYDGCGGTRLPLLDR